MNEPGIKDVTCEKPAVKQSQPYIQFHSTNTYLILFTNELKAEKAAVYFVLNFLAKFANQFTKLVPAFRNVTSSVRNRLFSYNAVAAE